MRSRAVMLAIFLFLPGCLATPQAEREERSSDVAALETKMKKMTDRDAFIAHGLGYGLLALAGVLMIVSFTSVGQGFNGALSLAVACTGATALGVGHALSIFGWWAYVVAALVMAAYFMYRHPHMVRLLVRKRRAATSQRRRRTSS